MPTPLSAFSKALRWPSAAFLSARATDIWKKGKSAHRPIGIYSQVNPKEYHSFFLGFSPKQIGDLKVHFSSGSVDGSGILTISKNESRPLNTILFKPSREKRLKEGTGLFKENSILSNLVRHIKIKGRNRLFKGKFTLTQEIETHLPLPFDRKKVVCAVTNLIGPTERKYFNSKELAEKTKSELGMPWQNYLLAELIDHAKSQGCGAVAFLRPEFNVDLSKEHLQKAGVSPKEMESIWSQYYASARKTGFRKIEGSKFMWKFL